MRSSRRGRCASVFVVQLPGRAFFYFYFFKISFSGSQGAHRANELLIIVVVLSVVSRSFDIRGLRAWSDTCYRVGDSGPCDCVPSSYV